jgi:predicted RNA-binding Zn ribbon-like protein
MTIKDTKRRRRPRSKETKPRHYYGKAEASLLLPLLNNGTEAEKAVLQEIVFTLKALEKVTPITRSATMKGDEAQLGQLGRVTKLNRILRAYEAIPTIVIRHKDDPDRNKGTESREAQLKLRWRRRGGGNPRHTQAFMIDELNAVLLALQLAEDGLIHKIRQCGICGRWFFGKGRNGQWCGDSCKTANYRTPLEKKRHAESKRANRKFQLRGRPPAEMGRKAAPQR